MHRRAVHRDRNLGGKGDGGTEQGKADDKAKSDNKTHAITGSVRRGRPSVAGLIVEGKQR
ncbi:hypothetical protein [Magnetospirillum fulvum]|uniref:hypothetical protein n=1 Tax=Magnetospirillum fulvum TaxID=1082 RepID=UPI000401491B|nr:hypothetical protein [Magnetospirillum fulvum]